MKRKINFEITKDKVKKHQIFLGRNTKITCKNKTQLESYLLRYKKFITNNVNILNGIEIQLYSLYRSNIMLLSSHDSLRIKSMFHLFEDSYERIFQDFSEGNQNTFVLYAVKNCFIYLFDFIEYLKLFAQKGKHYTLLNTLSFNYINLDILYQKFNNDSNSLQLTSISKTSKLTTIYTSVRLGA